MDFHDAQESRHSIRSFTSSLLTEEERSAFGQEIAHSNEADSLHMSLAITELEALNSFLAHHGKFRNVSSYLLLADAPTPSLKQCAGDVSRVVLTAQELGFATC